MAAQVQTQLAGDLDAFTAAIRGKISEAVDDAKQSVTVALRGEHEQELAQQAHELEDDAKVSAGEAKVQQRSATQRNAAQRHATQRNATHVRLRFLTQLGTVADHIIIWKGLPTGMYVRMSSTSF